MKPPDAADTLKQLKKSKAAKVKPTDAVDSSKDEGAANVTETTKAVEVDCTGCARSTGEKHNEVPRALLGNLPSRRGYTLIDQPGHESASTKNMVGPSAHLGYLPQLSHVARGNHMPIEHQDLEMVNTRKGWEYCKQLPNA